MSSERTTRTPDPPQRRLPSPRLRGCARFPWLVLESVAEHDVTQTADTGIQLIRSLGQGWTPTTIAVMSSDTTGTRAPLRLLFVGGRPELRTALATSSLAELVTDPADADCALVDMVSLTPAAHAEACHYPFLPSLPLVIVSAIGADRLMDATPYLGEVARAESTAIRARADHIVLRCAPMDVDLVRIARQIKDFATVHGCFTDAAVPWLALDDLIEVIALLTTEPMRRSGRVYELTGQELAPVPLVVDRLATVLGSRARYHPVEPAELVTALCGSSDWDLDMACRVPGHQLWVSSGILPNQQIEQALHRAPRSLHACITQAATAVTPQHATAPAVIAPKRTPHE